MWSKSTRLDIVFPTRVGVFLLYISLSYRQKSLPHPRGGVSGISDAFAQLGKSSPPAWGCFRPRLRGTSRGTVFPTRVGVFPKNTLTYQ